MYFLSQVRESTPELVASKQGVLIGFRDNSVTIVGGESSMRSRQRSEIKCRADEKPSHDRYSDKMRPKGQQQPELRDSFSSQNILRRDRGAGVSDLRDVKWSS